MTGEGPELSDPSPRHSPSLELQTKVRADFKITEKAPLSHLKHY